MLNEQRATGNGSYNVLNLPLLCLSLSSGLFSPLFAANFDSPAAITDTSSAMYTTTDIYNRLNAGTAGTKRTTTFTEPAAAPTAATAKDLNEIMSVAPTVDDTDGATTGEVLSGKKFWSLQSGNWGLKTGTLATQTLDPASNTLTAGNYAGTTLSAEDTDLTAANIKSGITIFGVTGSANVATYPAPVPKTGQTKCYDTTTSPTLNALEACASPEHDGQDGLAQKGVAHASPRFTKNVNTANDVGVGGGIASNGICDGAETCNGTVTDNSTGLIWLANANCANIIRSWSTALTDVVQLNTNGTINSNNCGDISNAGTNQTDWRLPNVKELQSLIDFNYFNPALPDTAGTAQWTEGNPFSSVVSNWYWSSTINVYFTGVWIVNPNDGSVNFDDTSYYVWPVRGGQ